MYWCYSEKLLAHPLWELNGLWCCSTSEHNIFFLFLLRFDMGHRLVLCLQQSNQEICATFELSIPRLTCKYPCCWITWNYDTNTTSAFSCNVASKILLVELTANKDNITLCNPTSWQNNYQWSQLVIKFEVAAIRRCTFSGRKKQVFTYKS